MINRAKELKQGLAEIGLASKLLLQDAVDTHNLGLALKVYQEVEDILPTTRWIPSRETYPLFRAYIDDDDTWRREGVYGFLDRFEEEVWFYTEASEEDKERIRKEGNWDPTKYEALLWEVVKNKNGEFTLDW